MDFGVLIILALAVPVCAFGGFFMALGQRRQFKLLEVQFATFESRLQDLERRLFEAPPVVEKTDEEREPATAPELAEEPLRDEPAQQASHAPSSSPADTAGARPGLEETLGTRWAVWVGGVALALGGVFLVRYSIEQGLFGPSARVAAGILFAAALLGAGEWMRRRETASAFPGIPSAHVPGVLTAAGTSTAFATIYAAYALYGMLPPAIAFVLLGVVSVLAMTASVLHGPALAALGLIAAFGSPLLVTTSNPNLWALVLYLVFVVLASYGVARLRLWRWLALAGSIGAILWTSLFPLQPLPRTCSR